MCSFFKGNKKVLGVFFTMMSQQPSDHHNGNANDRGCVNNGGESNLLIIDESGMCVVDMGSIKKRISTMNSDEKVHVEMVSERFLPSLIQMVHCKNLWGENEMIAQKLALCVLEDIHMNRENYFRSFRDRKTEEIRQQQHEKQQQQDSENALYNSLLGVIDPIQLLNVFMPTNEKNPDGSDVSAASVAIKRTLEVLKGFNPIQLDDFVVLKMCRGDAICNSDGHCSSVCRQLQTETNKMVKENDYSKALNLLMMFFRCMDHKRVHFGGDGSLFDVFVASRQAHMTLPLNMEDCIVFPLRRVLLACIDFIAADKNYSVSRVLCRDWSGDANTPTVVEINNTLTESTKKMSLEERAFLSMVYSFLIFSKFVAASADTLNRFLYVLIARFVYTAAEILWCERENSSELSDGGKFLRYVSAFVPAVCMANPFVVEQAVAAWKDNESDTLGPIVRLLDDGWSSGHTPEKNTSLKILSEELKRMLEVFSRHSHLVWHPKSNKKTRFTGLDNIRSVRYNEYYVPYGIIESCNRGSVQISSRNLPLSCRHSSGSNIRCNGFTLLSHFPGCEQLGPNGNSPHAEFPGALIPLGDTKTQDSGRFLGFITNYIDKEFIQDRGINNTGNYIGHRVLEKTAVCLETISKCYTLPNRDQLGVFSRGRGTGVVTTAGGENKHCVAAQLRSLIVYLPWQRPNIPRPNLSALAASQLELMMSRSTQYFPTITKNYFHLERVCFQVTSAAFKSISEEMGAPNALKKEATVATAEDPYHTLAPFGVNNAQEAQAIMEKAFEKVRREFALKNPDHFSSERGEATTTTTTTTTTTPTSNCGSFTPFFCQKLYDSLRDVIIKNDWSPRKFIIQAPFLCKYAVVLDDIFMRMIIELNKFDDNKQQQWPKSLLGGRSMPARSQQHTSIPGGLPFFKPHGEVDESMDYD